jgi:predicted acylesterase/phospholipase RssA
MDGSRLFDIVAGTSIGAINSAVIVGHYLKNNNSWEGSAEKILEFWEGLMHPTIADYLFDKNSFFRSSWDYLHTINPSIADTESARRFWSIFEFAFTPRGVPNMYESVPKWGSKFLNPFTDFLPWWQYDYKQLRSYLSKFVDFPIKTSLEKDQPRLLLTSVDIQDYAAPVVFDSYEKLHDASVNSGSKKIPSEKEEKKNGNGSSRWYSEYGKTGHEHIVFYDGIGPDQVLASALGKYAIDHPQIEDKATGTMRQLWDGGYLSNTPLRQLLTAHRNYWTEYLLKNRRSSDDELFTPAPELEVYIINLHALSQSGIPQDKDLIDDRENDILFHDRTTHDEHTAYLMTDFENLATDLVKLARSKGLSKSVDEILERNAKTIARIGKKYRFTTYRGLLVSTPRISKVWRIDRLDSTDATFGKITDFTPSTIRKLIQTGEIDARISIDKMEMIFAIEDLISDGIMSIEEGETIMDGAREVLTTEQLLYKKTKEEATESYNKFVKVLEAKGGISPERKEMLLKPVKDIVTIVSERDRQIDR